MAWQLSDEETSKNYLFTHYQIIQAKTTHNGCNSSAQKIQMFISFAAK